MKSITNSQRKIKEVVEIGHWWTRRQLKLFILGYEPERHKGIESGTLALVKKRYVRQTCYQRKAVYSISGSINHIHHGVMCTEVLVRLALADSNCIVVGEGEFRGRFGIVPEVGILYPNGTFLLVEYCTRNNAARKVVIPKKVNGYKKYLPLIEKAFGATAVTLFVIDMEETAVKQLAARYLKGLDFIYFSSHQEFFNVPLGASLNTSIYFMADGTKEALRDV